LGCAVTGPLFFLHILRVNPRMPAFTPVTGRHMVLVEAVLLLAAFGGLIVLNALTACSRGRRRVEVRKMPLEMPNFQRHTARHRIVFPLRAPVPQRHPFCLLVGVGAWGWRNAAAIHKRAVPRPVCRLQRGAVAVRARALVRLGIGRAAAPPAAPACRSM